MRPLKDQHYPAVDLEAGQVCNRTACSSTGIFPICGSRLHTNYLVSNQTLMINRGLE